MALLDQVKQLETLKQLDLDLKHGTLTKAMMENLELISIHQEDLAWTTQAYHLAESLTALKPENSEYKLQQALFSFKLKA
jgi:hypothetical protein